MAENTEIEDRVDLDDDNYSEDDDEEPMEDERAGEGVEEIQEDTRSEDERVEHSSGSDRNDTGDDRVDGEENSGSEKNEEKEKHAELLDLPPHGSEIFIGGLSREISEEDLRELCEPYGEIFEVSFCSKSHGILRFPPSTGAFHYIYPLLTI